MKKIIPILQGVLRLVMLIVAIGMLGASLFFVGVHMANKNLDKTLVIGQVVQGSSVESIHEVVYQFDGQKHQERPLDTYFYSLGQVGQKINIYVANRYPERIFVSKRADNLMITAGFAAGWGLFLGVILLGERQLMGRIKALEKAKEEE